MSKNLNDFIKYVDDNHNNINDYILMSSFNNLQKDYNITLQKEKNKEVIRENQQETGEILQESIPADELEEAEEEAEEEADKEPEEPEEPDDDDEGEIQKFINFLDRTVFEIKGVQGYGHARIKKELLGTVLKNGNSEFYSKLSTKEIKKTYLDELIPLIQEFDTKKQQKSERILIQEAFKISFFNSFPDEIVGKNKRLFTDEIVGTGYGMSDNTYITMGKYLVHKYKIQNYVYY